MVSGVSESFPRQYARTQRFTLGAPRNIVVSRDGRRVVFLRSAAGDDPVNSLWVLDVATATERCVADPLVLLADEGDGDLPPEERARRERAREGAGGITAYATDAATTVVAFAIAGRLFVGGLITGAARELVVDGPVFDPRPDPTAQRVAFVRGPALCVTELDGRTRVLAEPTAGDAAGCVSWGSAEFVAAEEMGRMRGYWWSPDGTRIAATRVDVAGVDTWVIADPSQPWQAARDVRYPAAGTANADVSLHVLGLDGSTVEVGWDRGEFPYLVKVDWTTTPLLLVVQRRDQRATMVLEADPVTGDSTVVAADEDDDWVEIVAGSPLPLADGRLVMAADRDGARRLLRDGEPVTPSDLQVRSIVGVDGRTVWFEANPLDDATSVGPWTLDLDTGVVECAIEDAGIHRVSIGGDTVVITSSTLEQHGTATTVASAADMSVVATIASFAATPAVDPLPRMLHTEANGLAVAVLLPHDHDGSPLPVLLDPYGGPHAQRVVDSLTAYATSQWFADQGFAVVVADGRGTPGRGSAWERAVAGDLASVALDDQIEALHAAADDVECLDLGRVAIRGWSFGGYLAALAVLRRPDVVHAAIAGAPVTEWRLYDTHYTERYLDDPAEQPATYDASSLIPLAPQLTRPLLLIHGLADDNVVAAHTLQLSSALLAAGRPHEVLPLSGVTHMTPQEEIAENLLLHQLDFLRRSLTSR
jgi:dipeptidyl-peptidase-4